MGRFKNKKVRSAYLASLHKSYPEFFNPNKPKPTEPSPSPVVDCPKVQPKKTVKCENCGHLVTIE